MVLQDDLRLGRMVARRQFVSAQVHARAQGRPIRRSCRLYEINQVKERNKNLLIDYCCLFKNAFILMTRFLLDISCPFLLVLNWRNPFSSTIPISEVKCVFLNSWINSSDCLTLYSEMILIISVMPRWPCSARKRSSDRYCDCAYLDIF